MFALTAMSPPAVAARAAKGTRGRGAKVVAVQPVDGPNTDSTRNLRSLVVRIVRGRGFRPMTSLPRYESTGHYPGLARDHHLNAFVTTEVEDRGRWQRVTFLVWDGVSGSIRGRWTASAPANTLPRTVGRGFWTHLGPALKKASAPPLSPFNDQAAPMRIDASDGMDEPIAAR
ncbi:MAG: hypothetical protein ABUS79_00490 [Pseudomonadota bacterium]